MKRVLFDINIIVDILLARDNFAQKALDVLKMAEDKYIKGYVSASAMADIFYIVKQACKDKAKADQGIDTILSILKVAKVDEKCIRKAKAAGWKDFEDAIQNECAVRNHIKIIITRNEKDYKQSKLQIMNPVDFLTICGK